MANQEYLDLLAQGKDNWNIWRDNHPDIQLDLSEAHLSELGPGKVIIKGIDLTGFNLREVILSGAILCGAALNGVDLSEADLQGADLEEANLCGANLCYTNLNEANLCSANLNEANLRGAWLNEADLYEATLVKAHLNEAELHEANLVGADLREADLSGAILYRATLSHADLSHAILFRTILNEARFHWSSSVGSGISSAYYRSKDVIQLDLRNNEPVTLHLLGGPPNANLSRANLNEADLVRVNLSEVNLSEASLINANLVSADLSRTNFTRANLSGANLNWANLAGANLTEAILINCSVYGVAAWDVQLDGATQKDFFITLKDEPIVSVDNLKVAQFIYLLLKNQEIRDVIDTLKTKAVLILGRFTPERKVILDAIKETLRKQNYLPILFDFEKSRNQVLTETISTLANLSRFIIADLTDPSSIPHELSTIIPNQVVPIVPLFHPTDQSRHEYAMFRDLRIGREWVLPIYHYTTLEDLLATLQTHVIEPAEKKARELVILKNSPET